MDKIRTFPENLRKMDFICYFCVFKRYLKYCMMTKRKLLYILTATILMLLAACNRQRNEADRTHLNKLDSLLAVQPEAAADSLKTFSNRKLSRFNSGYYQLLEVIVLDKNYYNFTSDSLISTAEKKLSGYKRKDPHTYARSLMYLGLVRYRMGVTDSTAYTPLKEAAEYFQRYHLANIKNEYLSNYYLGTIHHKNENIHKSTYYYQKALSNAKFCKDSIYQYNAYQELFWNQMYLENYKIAKQYLDTLDRYRNISASSGLNIDKSYAFYYKTQHDYPKALEYQHKILRDPSIADNPGLYATTRFTLSTMYFSMNRLDSALHYARLSLANPDTANSNLYLYYQNLASIALKKKDWRISAEAFDDMYRLYKKHTELRTGKKILELEKRYDKSEAENRVLEYQKKYAIISVLAVLLLMFLIASMLYVVQKRKHLLLEKQLREANLRNIESENLLIKQESKLLDEKNRVLVIKKRETERLLLEKEFVLPFYHQISNRNNELKRLLEYLMDNIKDRKLAERIIADYQSFTKSTDISEDNPVNSELLKVFTGLTEEAVRVMNNSEKLLLVFKSIGLENEQIAVLFNTTSDSIRSRKSKLKKKLELNDIHYPN